MPTPTELDLARRMGLQMQRLRSRNGHTQKDAATRVGMHVNQWAKYERGEQVMPLRYVQAIESAFAFSFEMDAPTRPKPPENHPPEYYKGMLDTARRLMALGQQISEEAMDGLTAAAMHKPPEDGPDTLPQHAVRPKSPPPMPTARLTAAAGAVAVRKAAAKPRAKRSS